MNTRSPLIKTSVVTMLTGKTVNTIYALADGGDPVNGQLLWVWNVATNPAGQIRSLRFWVDEVVQGPKVFATGRRINLALDQVIDFIVPPARREFPAGEVCQMFQVRPITLSGLRTELQGQLRQGTGYYTRTGLVRFLRNRWLGELPSQTKTSTREVR